MTNYTLTAAELTAVTGGHHDATAGVAPTVAGDPFAPVGSPERCAFLDTEIVNRMALISEDAMWGTSGGDKAELTPRIYGNGAILSRDQYEYRSRCESK
jgi:hypothetical protein